MKDTVKSLLESGVTPEIDFLVENTVKMQTLRPVTESEYNATRYTVGKVIVTKCNENGKYIVEYANNLERLMIENKMGINEALTLVAELNEIPLKECVVVFDESCASLIDFSQLISYEKEWDIARK